MLFFLSAVVAYSCQCVNRVCGTLCLGGSSVCAGPDGEATDHHAPVCTAALGLLAVTPDGYRGRQRLWHDRFAAEEFLVAVVGKTPADRAGDRERPNHHAGPASWRLGDISAATPAFGSSGKRAHLLRALYR